ncbi:MAG: PorT family protein [Proteobacteria bacterium]|nr:PorT family protein [Pseudomonadota bacterium]NDC23318.1 PorT family protein [Pseudomonadota bacterium]NDD03555.1 PorT family protein [Pseudomonadota bacterium]NDG25588.1 PorT family protein [Pseudomonadota bacterium]
MRFRKLLVGFLVVLGMSGTSQAALDSEGNYAFLGGMSYTNQILSTGDSNGTYLTGAYVGTYGDIRLTPLLVLSPGFFFVQKGVQDSSIYTRANYLETSALLKVYLVDNPTFRWYLGAGGSFGILLGANTVAGNGTSTPVAGLMNRNEVAAQGGMGFEFSVGEETDLILGATYTRALTSNLDINYTSGVEGRWAGIYGFVAIRVHEKREANTPEERAEQYLQWKNKAREVNQSPAEPTQIPESIQKTESVEEAKPQAVAPIDSAPTEDWD